MKTKRSLINVPNALSLLRLLLIPLFAFLYLTADRHAPAQYRWSAAVLLLSGLTDVADGAIARRFGQITPLGKILDPLADKLTQATVCICLTVRFPKLFFILILFVLKELTMLIAGAFLIKKAHDRPIPSSKWFGKLNTLVFHAIMLTIIAVPELSGRTVMILLLISCGFMLFSFIMYIPEFFRFKRELAEAPALEENGSNS